MSGGRIWGVAVVVAVAFALPATAFAGGSTQQIYADFASHGELVGHYSKAELEAALHDALVQGYGAPSTRAGLAPSVERQLQAGSIAGAEVALVQPQRSGALPFTGVDLGLIAAGGIVLLGLGRALRTLGARE